MTEGPQDESDRLRRVMALTPVGRQELRDPQSGLSLPQRWLLGHLDGESSLADLAALPGSPAADRLPRDAARLAGLGLAVDMGEPGPSASSFGPSTLYGEVTLSLPLDKPIDPPPAPAAPAEEAPQAPRRAAPALLLGVALAVVGGGVAWVASGGPDKAADRGVAVATVPASAAAVQAVAAPMASAAAAASGAASIEGVASGAAAGAVAMQTPAPPTAPAPPPVVLAAVAVPATPPPLSAALPQGPAARAPAAAVPVAPARPSAVPSTGVATAPTPSRQEPAPAAPAAVQPPAPQPAPPVAAVAPPVPVPAPAAVQTAAPQPTAAPAPPAPAPQPAPVQAQPPAAPLVVATAPATAAAPLRPVTLVEPLFPREGLGLGSRAVTLQARLVVAPNGSVSQVSFPQSNTTTRVFERAARSALLQWKFPEGAGERIVVQQLRFSEE